MSKHLNILLTFFAIIAFSTGQFGFGDFGARIQNQIFGSLSPFNNFGARIRQNINQQLAGLKNLGQRIQQNVNQNLEPIRIMESMLRVKLGGQGTTIATFSPAGVTLVIKQGNYYFCNGQINENGECSGVLEKMPIQRREDFCFVTSKNQINDWYCMSPNSNFKTVSYINGQVICETQDNGPKLLIKVTDYENMCRNVATSVSYKYFTNYPLEHVGYGLECSNGRPQVCSYSESLMGGGNFHSVMFN